MGKAVMWFRLLGGLFVAGVGLAFVITHESLAWRTIAAAQIIIGLIMAVQALRTRHEPPELESGGPNEVDLPQSRKTDDTA